LPLRLGGTWELVENAMILRSYAIATVVPDSGSIINSIGDILAAAAGFLITALLPVAVPVPLIVVVSQLLPHDNPWIALMME